MTIGRPYLTTVEQRDRQLKKDPQHSVETGIQIIGFGRYLIQQQLFFEDCI